jgi:hypothetical protein
MDKAVLELFDKIVQKPINLKTAEELADVINLLSQTQRSQLIALLLCASQGAEAFDLMKEIQAALQ